MRSRGQDVERSRKTEIMTDSKKKFAFVVLLMSVAAVWAPKAPVQAQGPSPYGSGQAGANGQSLPEVIEAIEKARVTTRILYVTAHPDDEPGALLAYLARGLHADVALLALTRGEGGQNALGPEQAPQLGVLRTEELMNATRVYGTRLFFTRARDFGFSKSPEETIQVWGDQVLEDMVRVIRTFRPHVIINNWGGVRSGHGHHQASGILTPKAYAMAADLRNFSQQNEDGLLNWRATRLLQLSRSGAAGGFQIPVNEISPLWGKSWGEIGIEGYLNHRTQGVGGVRSSPFFRRAISVVGEEVGDVSKDLFASRITWGLADQSLISALAAASQLDWVGCVRAVGEAGRRIRTVQEELIIKGEIVITTDTRLVETVDELKWVRLRIDKALAMAAGIRVDAQADRSEVVAGESFTVTVNWLKRNDVPVEIEGASLALPEGWSVTKEEKPQTALRPGEAASGQGGVKFTVTIPKDAKTSAANGAWIYPWPAALVKARLKAKVEGYEFETETEVTATRVTSVSAETRPLLLVPAVTLTVEPKEIIVARNQGSGTSEKQTAREIVVRVRHYATAAEKIRAGIDGPKEWPASPAQLLEFSGAGDQLVRFMVKLPAKLATGKYELQAWAKRADGEEFRTSLEPLPTLPTQMWSEPAVARVHVMDVTVPKDLRVGYVTADNDPIPQALREIGVHVELLDEQALAFGDLSKYDAIAIGIRAYELRSDLARANQRLLDYAAAGGTLVVQYQREGVWNQLKPAPYPATIGNGLRTTDENSPVRILEPSHPVLNFPNAIRIEDYSGWVQERGLYYWGTFDAKYTPVLAMRDPGEQEALGALVTARHGKGVYIYTGLSFFRQLPEGVPGAYRLFVNLLSQGKKK